MSWVMDAEGGEERIVTYEALLKSLPPRLRRHAVPLPAFAKGFMERWASRQGEMPLVEALRQDLRAERSLQVLAADFRTESLPALPCSSGMFQWEGTRMRSASGKRARISAPRR